MNCVVRAGCFILLSLSSLICKLGVIIIQAVGECTGLHEIMHEKLLHFIKEGPQSSPCGTNPLNPGGPRRGSGPNGLVCRLDWVPSSLLPATYHPRPPKVPPHLIICHRVGRELDMTTVAPGHHFLALSISIQHYSALLGMSLAAEVSG